MEAIFILLKTHFIPFLVCALLYLLRFPTFDASVSLTMAKSRLFVDQFSPLQLAVVLGKLDCPENGFHSMNVRAQPTQVALAFTYVFTIALHISFRFILWVYFVSERRCLLQPNQRRFQ